MEPFGQQPAARQPREVPAAAASPAPPSGAASPGSEASEDAEPHEKSRSRSAEVPGRVVSTTVHVHSTSRATNTTTTTTTTSSTRLPSTWRGGGKSRLGHTESSQPVSNSAPKWPPPWRGTAKTSRLIKARRIEMAAKGAQAKAASAALSAHPDLPSKALNGVADNGNMTLQSQSPKRSKPVHS